MRREDDSGFKWGPWEIRGPKPWRLRIEQLQGSVRYPYSQSRDKISQHRRQVSTEYPIIVKGNHVSDFTHPRDFDHDSLWWFWDNSLLPQFMQPNPANPRGDKIWTRLVFRGIFPGEYLGTKDQLDQREQEINELIRRESDGVNIRWQDICPVRPLDYHAVDRVLLCLCTNDMPWLYYGYPMNQIIESVRQLCTQRGWQLDIRTKPSRSQRMGNLSIDYQICHTRYRAVIGIHSAIGAEVIARGIPYVSIGQHAIGDLASTWQDLEQDTLVIPNPDLVYARFRQLLMVTRYKHRELLKGSWSLDTHSEQFLPLTDWTITL